MAALARALQLTVAERDHLYRLAHLVPPTDDMISDHIPPGVHRVLSRLGDTAVAVFAADWELVWWNRAWAALLGDPASVAPRLRNFARDLLVKVGLDGNRFRRLIGLGFLAIVFWSSDGMIGLWERWRRRMTRGRARPDGNRQGDRHG